jgi:hypothetical protein
MSSSSSLPTPGGPGSVSGAPNLPTGLPDTFMATRLTMPILAIGAEASFGEWTCRPTSWTASARSTWCST